MNRAMFNEWAHSVAMAAARHCIEENGLYAGRDGALRLARECGVVIPYLGEYVEKNISSTYSAICVIAYGLKPPIDAKEWLTELRASADKERKRFNERKQS